MKMVIIQFLPKLTKAIPPSGIEVLAFIHENRIVALEIISMSVDDIVRKYRNLLIELSFYFLLGKFLLWKPLTREILFPMQSTVKTL